MKALKRVLMIFSAVSNDLDTHAEATLELSMLEAERDLNHTCISNQFLDELDPRAGRHSDTVIQCDFMCQMADEFKGDGQ